MKNKIPLILLIVIDFILVNFLIVVLTSRREVYTEKHYPNDYMTAEQLNYVGYMRLLKQVCFDNPYFGSVCLVHTGYLTYRDFPSGEIYDCADSFVITTWKMANSGQFKNFSFLSQNVSNIGFEDCIKGLR